MITLEQVRALEARVEKALSVIDRLTAENAALRDSAAREKKRATDLERTIEEYRRDQTRIEQGILHALERLNAFEDAIQDPAPGADSAAADKPSRPAASASTAGRPASVVALAAASSTAVSSAASPKPAAAVPAPPEPASSVKAGTVPEAGPEEAELEIF